MKWMLAVVAIASLSACGIETATTAAASAEIKKREMDQAKKTMEQAKSKIEQNTQQIMERAADSADKTKD